MSSIVFSLDARAENITPDVYTIYQKFAVVSTDGKNTELYMNDMQFSINDGNQHYITHDDCYTLYRSGGARKFQTQYVYRSTEPPLLKKDRSVSINMYDIAYSVGLKNKSTGVFSYYRELDSAKLLLGYSDNTYEYITNGTWHLKNNKVTYEVEFLPLKDVVSVTLVLEKTFTPDADYYLTSYLGELNGVDSGFQLHIDQTSEETAELKGIKGVLQNVFNSITELPQKLWNIISDGLKSLFIPSEDYLVQFKEDLDSMLEEKLGAVYQVIDITMNSWDKIKDSDATNTINFPKVEIALLGGDKFSFGGYDVKIVPDGFSFIIESIKLIVGICASLLFINGLRKRYDEVMGVDQ